MAYFAKAFDEFLQVHPYAKLAWTVLNAAQRVSQFRSYLNWVLSLLQIVTDQIARDGRIRDLWSTVGDILDRLDALGKHKDERLYKKKVELILKQIYQCVLFLRWYGAKGFGSIRSFYEPRTCVHRRFSSPFDF